MVLNYPECLLDVATGTGDLMILAGKKHHFDKITGLDISEGMLNYARKKVSKLFDHDSGQLFEFIQGPAERIPLHDNSYDRICVGFGVRNFEDLPKGLAEMHRVLKPGGTVYILEFSKPRLFLFAPLYYFYFKNILPLFGRIISKDKEAYTYLFKTVNAFPDCQNFTSIMDKSGYINVTYKPLSLGICTIYTGSK